MATRGRRKGFVMPEEHRNKIRISQLLSRLCDLAEGKITPESMPAHAVTAALGVLRKALPDLSAQELSVTERQPFALLPAQLEDAETWESASKPKSN